MGERARARDRYTAFLSYSHKDAAAAGRLHRRLEAYRLPRRLAGSETARGIVPDRLWPIFRDREELPAATDLSETVREALAQSGALIVLCSPHSAESLWVAEEIETFRRLHPDRPILAAILEGDPPDCFPRALRAFGQDGTWHEPLATDLRRGRDGLHLGLLKLVAGITGVGLDALVQRDAARKIRRVTAVTAVSVIAMLIMAALTWVALDARREAERQRAEAEGQIEFMLTDLRARLRGVGRIDIMTAVNRRALQYYGGPENWASLQASSVERRARILHAIGEDEITQGRLPAAFIAFRDAHRTTAFLLARDPGNPERIFVHGQSEYWLGRVHELRRNWPAAGRQYALYATAAERLVRIAPNNPDYMLEMAWGALNRGIVQKDGNHNPAAAQAFFEVAVSWFERAIRVRPRNSDLRDLANAYSYLADSFYARQLWQPSLVARLRQYRIIERALQFDAANVELAYRRAIAERAIGMTFLRTGDPAAARRFLLRAYEGVHRLTARDPGNAEWLLFQTKVECAFLSRTLPFNSGIAEDRLQRSIRASAAVLSNQNHPSFTELEPCLIQLN